MDEVIINKVSESALITLNLEEYYPKEAIVLFDMKDHLFMGLILKEKDFREALKNLDLTIFTNKAVGYLQPVAKEIIFGTEEELKKQLLMKNIARINLDEFIDKRVVIKGCGELPVGEAAYLEATKLLRPIAKSIMYGEPCSTVPIFKRK